MILGVDVARTRLHAWNHFIRLGRPCIRARTRAPLAPTLPLETMTRESAETGPSSCARLWLPNAATLSIACPSPLRHRAHSCSLGFSQFGSESSKARPLVPWLRSIMVMSSPNQTTSCLTSNVQVTVVEQPRATSRRDGKAMLRITPRHAGRDPMDHLDSTSPRNGSGRTRNGHT